MKIIDGKNGRCWQARIRKVYDTLAELKAYDEIYGVVKRLGLASAEQAWKDNPVISGSVDPRDLRVVKRA